MEKNILLTIEYDGTDFNGWQIQPGVRTVQGTLEEALSKYCGIPVKLNGTSRTDSGVHALGQRASFKGEFGIPADRLKTAVNNYLSGGLNQKNGVGDVRIVKVEEVDSDFHARFDCKGKTYRYVINNSPRGDMFRRNYEYWVPVKLDIDAMRIAAEHIEGTHDFKCFETAGGTERETTVRTVSSISVRTAGRAGYFGEHERDSEHAGCLGEHEQESKYGGRNIIIDVTGDGFLYNMVRIIVGTLVEVGQGKRQPESLTDLIEKRDRANAGHTAPAEGLYLKEIYF